MPRVSVITPNYNHARFLPMRLESILGQTFGDFELIVLDDASPDDSREVISRYTGDPRVRTVFNERNSGSTFRQWNLGLSRARGEYVWFAESDDAADPALLETLVDRLDRYPDVGLAYCQSRAIDEDDRPIDDYLSYFEDHFDMKRFEGDFVNNGRDECINYLYYVNTIPNASAVLFRKSVLERAGGAADDMVLAGDWMTYARVLLISDIAFAADPMNYFRKHRGTVRSKVTSTGTEFRETRKIQRMLCERLGSPEIEQKYRDTLPQFVGQVIYFARKPPHNKVLPRDALELLIWLARYDLRALKRAVPILAKEHAAGILRRLGLLGAFKKIRHAEPSSKQA
jgi:glycosyltransferase involved in cell wall biosynthesis